MAVCEQVAVPGILEHVAQPKLPLTAPTACQRIPSRVVFLAEPLPRLYEEPPLYGGWRMDYIPSEPTRGEFSVRDKKGRALTSKIVIPIAYISVSLEGSCFASLPVNPNLSGKNNSGAIHRVVPFILPSRTVVLLVVSSTIAASPKSAKRARHSESIRTLTLRDHSVSLQIVQYVKNSLP